jgi:hypothetical protein
MKQVTLGFLFACVGTVSMSLAMNLWKASDALESHLPWYWRKRFMTGLFLGVFMNTAADGVAFSMTPLSLIAPMQGMTIALTVLFAAMGIGGHHEKVSLNQWKAIAVTITGLVLASWYGPFVEAERAWWPLLVRHRNPKWLYYLFATYAIAIFVFVVQRVPTLRILAPAHGSMAWSILAAGGSGLLAGLLQTQLKVLAQCVGILAHSPHVACRHAHPGFCRYNVTTCAGDACAGVNTCSGTLEHMYWDPICNVQTHLVGRTIPAYPMHWLFGANAWGMVPTALLQLNMMNTALVSNDMAVAVTGSHHAHQPTALRAARSLTAAPRVTAARSLTAAPRVTCYR